MCIYEFLPVAIHKFLAHILKNTAKSNKNFAKLVYMYSNLTPVLAFIGLVAITISSILFLKAGNLVAVLSPYFY